ncbi:MAG: hypothetical protein Q8920_04335 [Bacillota bacterium]|nr:hypothetical protein [Bacillota bacterium]
MKRTIFPLVLSLLFCLLFYGCSQEVIAVGPKTELTASSEKILNVSQALNLSVNCDYANIEFYSWDKKNIKFEITKFVRGLRTNQKLKNELDNIKTGVVQDGANISFTSVCSGNIKSPSDTGINLIVYLPKKIDALYYKLDTGSVKFHDDIACKQLKANVSAVNTEIKGFKGAINFTGDAANLRIENGRIAGNSSVKINMGNLYVTASYSEGSSYTFETEMGVIELTAPEASQISFETQGSVDINEFAGASYPTVIKVVNSMGRITIRKSFLST